MKVGDKVIVKDNLESELRRLTFYEETCVSMAERFVGTEQEIFALWKNEDGQEYATVDLCCEIPVQCLSLNKNMKEILGRNLKKFFDTVDSKCKNADITYAGDRYEVWEVSDELFDKMCDMSEEEFVVLAGEDAWWRSAEGSNLGIPDTTVHINGHELLGWVGKPWVDGDIEIEIYSDSLTDYLCDVVGASQPKNVCAYAVDLSKYNNMTIGELFTKYEG